MKQLFYLKHLFALGLMFWLVLALGSSSALAGEKSAYQRRMELKIKKVIVNEVDNHLVNFINLLEKNGQPNEMKKKLKVAKTKALVIRWALQKVVSEEANAAERYLYKASHFLAYTTKLEGFADCCSAEINDQTSDCFVLFDNNKNKFMSWFEIQSVLLEKPSSPSFKDNHLDVLACDELDKELKTDCMKIENYAQAFVQLAQYATRDAVDKEVGKVNLDDAEATVMAHYLASTGLYLSVGLSPLSAGTLWCGINDPQVKAAGSPCSKSQLSTGVFPAFLFEKIGYSWGQEGDQHLNLYLTGFVSGLLSNSGANWSAGMKNLFGFGMEYGWHSYELLEVNFHTMLLFTRATNGSINNQVPSQIVGFNISIPLSDLL